MLHCATSTRVRAPSYPRRQYKVIMRRAVVFVMQNRVYSDLYVSLRFPVSTFRSSIQDERMSSLITGFDWWRHQYGEVRRMLARTPCTRLPFMSVLVFNPRQTQMSASMATVRITPWILFLLFFLFLNGHKVAYGNVFVRDYTEFRWRIIVLLLHSTCSVD
jgi:hypothetical protein